MIGSLFAWMRGGSAPSSVAGSIGAKAGVPWCRASRPQCAACRASTAPRLNGESVICTSSVETRERRVDADARAQRPIERAPGHSALEALQARARVRAPPRSGPRNELPSLRVEALQLVLGRLAAAAGAGADRVIRPSR